MAWPSSSSEEADARYEMQPEVILFPTLAWLDRWIPIWI